MSDRVAKAFQKVKEDISAINKRVDKHYEKTQTLADDITLLKQKKGAIKQEISSIETTVSEQLKSEMQELKKTLMKEISSIEKRFSTLKEEIDKRGDEMQKRFNENVESINTDYVKPLNELKRNDAEQKKAMDSLRGDVDKRFKALETEIEKGLLSLAKPLTSAMRKLEASQKKVVTKKGAFSGIINALSDDK